MSLYERVRELSRNDNIQVFGPSGSGKTTFCVEVAKDAVRQGRKVIYLDAEGNMPDVPEGVEVIYTPRWDELLNYIRNLPKADLLIIDSIGMPVLSRYAAAGMDEKGKMLLQMVTFAWHAKQWCYLNQAPALITNQPVSSFGKPNTPEEELRPFGDKSLFAFKECWRTKIVESTPHKTVCEVQAWRSRRYGRSKLLFRLTITDSGVEVDDLLAKNTQP